MPAATCDDKNGATSGNDAVSDTDCGAGFEATFGATATCAGPACDISGTAADKTACCTECAGVQFALEAGACTNHAITSCPAGEGWSGTTTADDGACTPCVDGTSWNAEDDANACSTTITTTAGCADGEYLVVSTASNDESCVACPAGKWHAASADRDAAVAAGECEDQSYTVCANAGEGNNVASALAEAGATQEVVCTACETGTFATASDNSCETLTASCPAGQGFTGQVTLLETDNTCADCGKNKYSGANDRNACADCAAGSVTEVGAGTGAVTSGATTCTLCGAGTWDHDGDSSTACIPDPVLAPTRATNRSRTTSSQGSYHSRKVDREIDWTSILLVALGLFLLAALINKIFKKNKIDIDLNEVEIQN